MLDLFNASEMIMMGLVLFSSFWIFLFNYRTDNKDKYADNKWLILLDLLITVVFTNVPQLAAYESYRYPIGYLFGLTSNVSIPIVLKWFQQQITKKLNEAGKGK